MMPGRSRTAKALQQSKREREIYISCVWEREKEIVCEREDGKSKRLKWERRREREWEHYFAKWFGPRSIFLNTMGLLLKTNRLSIWAPMWVKNLHLFLDLLKVNSSFWLRDRVIEIKINSAIIIKVAGVHSFNSDNPSSNPADAFSFFVKFEFEKNENKHKRGLGWHV